MKAFDGVYIVILLMLPIQTLTIDVELKCCEGSHRVNEAPRPADLRAMNGSSLARCKSDLKASWRHSGNRLHVKFTSW